MRLLQRLAGLEGAPGTSWSGALWGLRSFCDTNTVWGFFVGGGGGGGGGFIGKNPYLTADLKNPN